MIGVTGGFCSVTKSLNLSPRRTRQTAPDQTSCRAGKCQIMIYHIYPCISRSPIFDGKKSNFLISLLNVHGILILHSSISGTVDSQKIKGLKRLIVLWFSGCCMCGHFVLEFRKSSQKIKHVNLKLTCFVVQG